MRYACGEQGEHFVVALRLCQFLFGSYISYSQDLALLVFEYQTLEANLNIQVKCVVFVTILSVGSKLGS